MWWRISCFPTLWKPQETTNNPLNITITSTFLLWLAQIFWPRALWVLFYHNSNWIFWIRSKFSYDTGWFVVEMAQPTKMQYLLITYPMTSSQRLCAHVSWSVSRAYVFRGIAYFTWRVMVLPFVRVHNYSSITTQSCHTSIHYSSRNCSRFLWKRTFLTFWWYCRLRFFFSNNLQIINKSMWTLLRVTILMIYDIITI